MDTVYDRTRMLIGAEPLELLKRKKIIVFGVGGVGGFAIEAFARAGVGHLTVVDFDTVDITNINRQIIALQSTVGKLKTEVMAARIFDINPEIKVRPVSLKLETSNISDFDLGGYDYILDAIDDIEAKLLLIAEAKCADVPILSSMGTGNKMDPSCFQIVDISKTHTCPLARVMRKRLAQMGIQKVNVLFSPELPYRVETPAAGEKASPASISFVPAAAGLILASRAVRDLIGA